MKMVSLGYTLWFIPKDHLYRRFAELIKKLAEAHDGPIFEPHVTLLGDIELTEEEVLTQTQQLVKNQKPFPLTLSSIGYEDFHFRALFVRAEITKPLKALHDKAKEIFGMQNVPLYMPHLSLLYGNYPNTLKEKIIKEIGKGQSAQWEVDSVHLKRGGEVKDWKIIKEFLLK